MSVAMFSVIFGVDMSSSVHFNNKKMICNNKNSISRVI